MDNEIQNMDSVLDGDTVVKEELSEDDDSDDEEYSSIQRPAFLVTGKPDFDSGPPQDGLEYLRRVRYFSLSSFLVFFSFIFSRLHCFCTSAIFFFVCFAYV